MESCCEQLEIDTKDICLLCLGSRSRVRNDSFDSSPSAPSLQGLKHLLRYLKVSPKELFNCSSEFLQSMEIREDIDLKISLCSGCSSVTEKFNKLYQKYELIQLQFGNCVQTLHESMSNGNEDPELVRTYLDQMRPNKSADLVNASIAANFRNETFKKCILKLQSETLKVRVALQKLDVDSLAKVNRPVLANNSIQVAGVRNTERFRLNTGCTDHSKNSKPTDAPKPQSFRRKQNLKARSTEEISEVEVIGEEKPTKTNINQTKSYFHSIKKKLKTKMQPTSTTATSTSNAVTGNRFNRNAVEVCQYCGLRYTQHKTLREHLFIAHAEHFISKFLPPDISLERCSREINAVWKQMFKISIDHCQFCMLKLNQRKSLKRHLICFHAEQFAIKVAENIQTKPALTPKDMPTDAGEFACKYCDSTFASITLLQSHKSYKHPEHLIYKFLPQDIPLESCKQGFNVALQQMQETSDSGYKCKFCTISVCRRSAFKFHLVSKHREQIALEAQRCIGLPVACSSTSRKFKNESCYSEESDSEDNNEFNQTSEMDLEMKDPSIGADFVCELCGSKLSSSTLLRKHTACMHPEQLIYKFCPPDIPMDLCKQGINVALQQMTQTSWSGSGYKCKFCTKTIVRKSAFKLHVVFRHGKLLAVEAQQCIDLLPEYADVAPSDAVASGSTLRSENESSNNTSEDESYQPCEMDVEMDDERVIKIENPPPENVELDPLIEDIV